ncbi:MAG: sulfatase-like hydrolase/transferase [Prevotellaceae bacterium]|nr:sulfatase-like hydrolase/transferase [Candidatus Faecinaster equi]
MRKSNNTKVSSLILFVLALIITLVKCGLFRSWCVAWLEQWYPTYSCLAEWLAIIAACLIVASIVLLCKRPWVSLIPIVLIDFWIIANVLYYRANHLLLSYSAIVISSNLHGFEKAILGYIDWKILLIPLMSCLYAVLTIILRHTRRYPIAFAVVWGVATILSVSAAQIRCSHRGASSVFTENEPVKFNRFNPFFTPTEFLPGGWELELTDFHYTLNHSIIAYFVNVFTDGAYHYYQQKWQQAKVNLTEEEWQQINQLMSKTEAAKDSTSINDGNLIILVVESWESWTLQTFDAHHQPVMPRLTKVMERHPYFLADKVIPQVRHGVSADGALLINTGLLPIIDGLTVFDYENNVYPNVAHFYPYSAIVDVCSKTWNVEIFAKNYGYQQHLAPEKKNYWFENITFDKAKQLVSAHLDSLCLEVITMATHSPFNWVSDQELFTSIDLPKDLSELDEKYLRAIYFTDYYMGDFLEYLESKDLFARSTIVITGDHTFNRDDVHFCPLLIFSPKVTDTQRITDKVYQMDIYPTILSLIGCKDYFWQGFGRDLTNPKDTQTLDAEQALLLSDKLIRMNYFQLRD